jgi:peroxiredoxin
MRTTLLALTGAWLAALLPSPPASAAPRVLQPVAGTVVAGDFVARDMQGKPAHFGKLRGRVVLLNFWATWCSTCRKEMPALEQLHRAYKDRGLVVLALSQDQAPLATVRGFVEEHNLSFPVWHDRDGLVGRQYSVPGVPTAYLIGADGRIAGRVFGEYDWFSPEARAAVEALLATPENDKR